MKIELNFSELKKAVSLIEKVAGKHMTLPVLSCILFEIKKNSLVLKATNLDVGVEVNISAKSAETATAAVFANVLSSFLNQIGDYDGMVNLELVAGNLKISTKTSQGVIKTLPHEDFPSMPGVVDGQTVTLAPEIIVKGLRAVSYSASISSVKPELASVYIYSLNTSV